MKPIAEFLKSSSVFVLVLGLQSLVGCRDSSVEPQIPVYTDEYIRKNSGKAQFSIPEVLELSQIAISLTDYKDKNRSGSYWTAVESQFGSYRTHPLITKLSSQVKNIGDDYDLRYGAFASRFDTDEKLVSGFYPDRSSKSIFNTLREDFEDFARKSNFRAFYRSQQPNYDALIKTQAQLMPIRQMWDWLEARFPARVQSQKIIFSPLIGGNHNILWFGNASFQESLMFVSYSGNCCQSYSQKVKEGLSSRVVFTEIDHKYVNAVSDEYKGTIDKIFRDRVKWTNSKDSDNYSTPIQVFNEYMTWAVFSLYSVDTFDKDDFTLINQLTERQMVTSRGFAKFAEFNQYILSLHKQDKNIKANELYMKILSWAESQ